MLARGVVTVSLKGAFDTFTLWKNAATPNSYVGLLDGHPFDTHHYT